MRIIKPSVEILKQEYNLNGMYKAIEQAGRACYASYHRVGDNTAMPFTEMLIKNGHTSCLEHGAVYLQIPKKSAIIGEFAGSPYCRYMIDGEYYYVSTNYRYIKEHKLDEVMQWMVAPTPLHEQRITVRFKCQIAISREFNRHRVNSIAEQSTRYCDYSKDKFGNEVGICLPEWLSEDEISSRMVEAEMNNAQLCKYCTLIATYSDNGSMDAIDYWLFANLAMEYSYMKLKAMGWQAQQARTILPLDTATDLVHSAFISDWKHFFELRCDKAHVHPDAYLLAADLKRQFIDNGII